MSLLIPKHPKDMPEEELRLYHQAMQANAKRNNQHAPTTTRSGQPDEATMRKETTAYHEKRYAQNTAAAAKGTGLFGSMMDMFKMATDSKEQADKEAYEHGYSEGILGTDEGQLNNSIKNSPDAFKGYRDGLKDLKKRNR